MSASWQRKEWFRQAVLLVSAVVFLLGFADLVIFWGAFSWLVFSLLALPPNTAWVGVPLLAWLWACWQGWRTRDTWRCRACRQRLAPGMTACVWCAAPIERCIDCGYLLKVPGSTTCPECGRETE